jgi:acyl-CoA thioesterase
MTPEQIAKRSEAAMRADDRAPHHLGISVETVEPGRATAAMVVTEAAANSHGICHGGYLFALADTAFAYASNSRRQRAVAQNCAISFLAPARIGSRITAAAREQYRGERTGIYDVTLSDENGDVIAEFRGTSRTVPGALF